MLKKAIKRIIYPHYYSNNAYVEYLRSGGADIGGGTYFYDPKGRPVDETSLPFIKIGSNCRITSGVTILAHDYSYAVLRPIYHRMLTRSGTVEIGNNVFIGIKSIITMNTKIGNNVIIGAGSVVTHNIPDNVVAAGNPAKVICSIDEYYKKCDSQFERAAICFFDMKHKYLKRPLNEKDMAWYNQLWDYDKKDAVFNSLKVDGDNKDQVVNDCLNVVPKYRSFEEFLEINHLDNN